MGSGLKPDQERRAHLINGPGHEATKSRRRNRLGFPASRTSRNTGRAPTCDNRRLMPRPWTGLLLTGGLATVVTLVMAWPVVLNPAHLIYGREIVGRHPDAYTVIHQFGTTGTSGLYAQPLTDLPGWLLARAVDPVVAFNIIVLLSFPLTAMATYALARSLTGSHGAGLVAGFAFAFSPIHLAHAAYHPHIAQIQWIPLYFLALIALVDRVSIGRIAGLILACAGLVLSNYYAGLTGAVMSPVVLIAFWAIRPDADRNLRPLVWPGLVLLLLAVGGSAILWRARPEVFADASTVAFPIEDVAFYRARWWAYLTPAVDHPFLGRWAASVFGSKGINLQLTEEQLFLGYALLLLAAVALLFASFRWLSDTRWRFVPALAVVGVVALLVSLGPISGSCEPASLAPACLIFRGAPMFRAFARIRDRRTTDGRARCRSRRSDSGKTVASRTRGCDRLARRGGPRVLAAACTRPRRAAHRGAPVDCHHPCRRTHAGLLSGKPDRDDDSLVDAA